MDVVTEVQPFKGNSVRRLDIVEKESNQIPRPSYQRSKVRPRIRRKPLPKVMALKGPKKDAKTDSINDFFASLFTGTKTDSLY